MSELTIEQLIKIIIGILVVVAVVLGIYMFFRDQVWSFFKNIFGGEEKLILALR
jgi:uncharacterized membrane protein